MTIGVMMLLEALGAVAAGLLGALTGLGGGIVIVPMLTLLLHVDIRYAIGASLVSVIATSSGAAAAYVREGYTNVRVGMLLEVATTSGAILGAIVAGYVSTGAVAVIFGAVLLFSAWRGARPIGERVTSDPPDRLAARLRLNGTYPSLQGERAYTVRHIPGGLALMAVAGGISGLLGIGSGVVKVVAMDQAMGLPFKVSTTTSNFMIGVTAAASAGIYLHRGYIDPALAFPVMIGVLAGALLGARLLTGARTATLRKVFTVVLVVIAIEMLYKGLTGGI
jgi:uncharacterized membrane protein YfcA